jgi:hypothetical protein
MKRVRKNSENLTDDEEDDFVDSIQVGEEGERNSEADEKSPLSKGSDDKRKDESSSECRPSVSSLVREWFSANRWRFHEKH